MQLVQRIWKVQIQPLRHEERDNFIEKIMKENSEVMNKLIEVKKSMADSEEKEDELLTNLNNLRNVRILRKKQRRSLSFFKLK